MRNISLLIIFFSFSLAGQPKKIGSIPFSVKEVKAVSKLMKGDMLLYENADYENVFTKIGNYDIIHFSLHAKLNMDDPLSSRFILAGGKDLFLSDIYSMNLKADLAVLSGCNTGIGKFFTGEGVMSFARAFRFA